MKTILKLFSGNGTAAKYRQLADMLLNTPIGIDNASARGWAYVLEQIGFINKTQFDIVEAWIGRCVEAGYLPIDFVASEASRQFANVEVPATATPIEDFGYWVSTALEADEQYAVDWWEGEEFYVEMFVEKVDLLTLFQPICAEYHIPIANAKGWSSRLQRGTFARRFNEAEARGQQCVLLYCGDHDPDGLRISTTLRKNIADLKNVVWSDGAAGYDPENLIIKRFGLNFDFIIDNGFTWIDNLKTGKPKPPNDLSDPRHKNHHLPYVQQYLAKIGGRKCEANVLVTNPEAGKQLCRDAIEEVLGVDAKSRFEAKHDQVRRYFQTWRKRSGLDQHVDAIRDLIARESEFMNRGDQ